jgi:cell division protein FtsN
LPTPPESTTVTQRLHGRVPSVLQPTTVQAANMDEVPAASQMGTPLPSRPGAPLSPGNGEIATTAPAREEDLVPRHIDGQFYVQAGSFRVSENAYQLAQRLKSYYEAKISPVVIEGVQWYRVQLGPINDFNTARQLLDKISHYGLTGAKIINE